MGRGAAVCNLGLLPHRTAYCRALSRHYLLLHSAAYPEPPYLAVLSALHRFRALKMKQGYRLRAFTASYSRAARHFSTDTFSCSEKPITQQSYGNW